MSCAGDFFSISGGSAVWVGYDWALEFQYVDESTDPETPIDLTGYTITMHIQERGTDVDVLTLSPVGNSQTTGVYTPDPTNGTFFTQIRLADTTALDEGTRDYVIKILDPSGNLTPFLSGDQVFEKVG